MPLGTVYIVDDDADVRRGLSRMLTLAGYMVETFVSAETYLAERRRAGPGCLILDVQMPGMDGLDLQQRLQQGKGRQPIIFITGHGDIPMTVQAMQAGAHTFFSKPFDADEILQAVADAIKKDAKSIARKNSVKRLQKQYEALTSREREVFLYLISGKLNKQIAADIGITEQTVKFHRRNLLEKFGVQAVTDLV